MKSLILCEGKMDAILISYLLINNWGWKYVSSNKENFEIPVNEKKDESANWYEKDGNLLLICGVGGNGKFFSFFDFKISNIQRLYEKADVFSKVIFITDKDKNKVQDIENEFSRKFANIIKNVKNEKWISNDYLDSFGSNQKLDVYLKVIPVDSQGALENVLIDSISEIENNSIVVNKTCDFVDNIRNDAKKYLTSDRLVLKAKLGTLLAIISPQKVFTIIDELIKTVDWKKSEKIINTFEFFNEI